jgi:hypothetical protein
MKETCANCLHGNRCDGCLEEWCMWGYGEEAAQGRGKYEIPMMVLRGPNGHCKRWERKDDEAQR